MQVLYINMLVLTVWYMFGTSWTTGHDNCSALVYYPCVQLMWQWREQRSWALKLNNWPWQLFHSCILSLCSAYVTVAGTEKLSPEAEQLAMTTDQLLYIILVFSLCYSGGNREAEPWSWTTGHDNCSARLGVPLHGRLSHQEICPRWEHFFNSFLLSECKYFHRDFLFFLYWLSKYRIWTIVFWHKNSGAATLA